MHFKIIVQIEDKKRNQGQVGNEGKKEKSNPMERSWLLSIDVFLLGFKLTLDFV